MFHDLPKYEGDYHRPIAWLDPIPVHWQRRRLGTLLREVDLRSETGEEQLLRVSQYTGVTERKDVREGTPDSRSASLVGYKKVAAGELAINIMLAWNGSLGVSRFDGLVSPAYCVYRFKSQWNPWFYHHLLRTPQYKAVVKAHSRGIVDSRLRLYSEDLYGLEAVVPPPSEQAAIVKYLAHANARIDKAINAKHRLIALLEEQRRRHLEDLVCGAGDPDQRETGLMWVPLAPSKWGVVRVKHIIRRIEQGWSPQCDAQPAEEREWGVTRAGCSNNGRFCSGDNKRLPVGLEARPELEIKHGDLLINRANSRELVGSAAVALEPRPRLMFSDKIFRVTVDTSKVDPEYLALSLSSRGSREQIEAGAVGASHSMQNISHGVIANLWLVLPPLKDQKLVVLQASRLSAESEAVLNKIQREIDLLQEFRTRLVADVVTGQVDVRGIAASLPEPSEFVFDEAPIGGDEPGEEFDDE